MEIKIGYVWMHIFSAALCFVSSASAQDASPVTDPAKSSLEIAEGVTIESIDGTAKFTRVDTPIYRFSDPARGFTDGSIWAFGTVGRPAALFTIAKEKRENGAIQWNHEFTLTTDHPIVAMNPKELGPWQWRPTEGKFSMTPLPNGPVPSDNGTQRLRQLKTLARRFTASELWTPIGQTHEGRFELRLLPQPIHRYADPSMGIVDGAIFLLSYGQNPEIALLIEATKTEGAPPTWSYGFGRIAGARLLIRFDGRSIADLPAPTRAGSEMPYGVEIVPITNPGAPRP
jgi:hypothetical protein